MAYNKTLVVTVLNVFVLIQIEKKPLSTATNANDMDTLKS